MDGVTASCVAPIRLAQPSLRVFEDIPVTAIDDVALAASGGGRLTSIRGSWQMAQLATKGILDSPAGQDAVRDWTGKAEQIARESVRQIKEQEREAAVTT